MDKLGVNVFNCLGNENVRVKNIKDILSLIRNYSYRKPLTLESLNPFLKEVEYAIRGKMHLRAAEIGEQMREGKQFKFKELYLMNIGDCQAMGQQPISFFRQVLTLAVYPRFMNHPRFPSDAKSRAKEFLDNCAGRSIGSYTDSFGIDFVRKKCAEYIERRDSYSSNWKDVFITNGATDAIRSILKLFSNTGGKKGVMVSVPVFPAYTAFITELDLVPMFYCLDENKNWALNIKDLKKVIKKGRKVCDPAVLVVINPGNPTGQVLTRKNIEELIKFAYKNNLLIIADEIYQDNVYTGEFHSFKKVASEMGKPYNKIQLASFMSISKGYMGECGFRSGYCELFNIDADVRTIIYKSLVSRMCANTAGQCMLSVVANPPQENEPSYEKYLKEKMLILKRLNERGILMYEKLNKIPGFKSNPLQGALYIFPKFYLPPKAIEAAKKAKLHPDVFYCLQLLEETGVLFVPGSGFGQVAGTNHFRSTVLLPTAKIKKVLRILSKFHIKFLRKYRK